MTKFVAYYRVSTKKQGRSGLGLEAQRTAIKAYVNSVNGEIVTEYTDIQTAANTDRISINNKLTLQLLLRKRPGLTKAINTAVTNGYMLVVKEYSRLSRFSLLIDYLLSTGVKFVCADSPYDEPLIVKIKVAIFEQEWLNISQRTKLAMAERKKKGLSIGGNTTKLNKMHKKRRNQVKSATTKRMNAAMHEDYRKAHFIALMMYRENKTKKEILEMIEKLGYRTELDKPITQHMLERIMQNEFITGEI